MNRCSIRQVGIAGNGTYTNGITWAGGSGGTGSTVYFIDEFVLAPGNTGVSWYQNSSNGALGQSILSAANLEGLFTAAGQMFVGTGLGTGAPTTAPSGLTDISFAVAAPIVSAGAVSVSAAANRINNVTVSATTAITMSTSGAVDGQLCMVRILDGGSVETLSWVNTENSTNGTAPLASPGSATLPTTVGFQYNGATSKWRCIGVS